MKYLFLFSILLLLGYIITLQYQIDGSSYPFGSRLHPTRVIGDSSGGFSEIHKNDLPNYSGYRVGNRYRVILLVIGSGVGLVGALGWIAIRKAERRNHADIT